ncbi:MAG: adenylate kinase family protein [Halobacteria archaeon]|nr:adenylate kinase family protein [Halobacteria archaeon]
MRVVITGTPGTGKTTVSEEIADELDLEVVHLNQLIEEKGLSTGVDEDRDTLVADIDAVTRELESRDGVVIEGHLAHHLEGDSVIVLRCRPDVLKERLSERGYTEEKARENAESEALDLILSEAMAVHGENVYEIDTTDKTPQEVVSEAIDAVKENKTRTGVVNWFEFIEGLDS